MNIGILNAYHFEQVPGNYQEEYSQIFIEFVKSVFPDKKTNIIEYKVALGNFPKSVSECDIWFITGSPKSVYEDITWIHQLTDFTKKLHANKKKLVGICFGHQMVAHALGGKVLKSARGWGVGIREFNITQKQTWMTPVDNKMSLIFSHQDQVEIPPPNAKLLAGDEFCSYQMLQIGEHILSFQGHPEFTEKFAKDRLNSRKQLMPLETYQTALDSFKNKNDSKQLIAWIQKFVNNN
ncbi:MAG: GMP synthase [Bdellovibrionota bacterium]